MQQIIAKSDLARLLQEDDRLIGGIGRAIASDPEACESLAGGLAAVLSDQLAQAPEIRRKIVAAAIGSDEFKRQIVQKLTLRTRSRDSCRARDHAVDPPGGSLVPHRSAPQLPT